MLNKLESLLHKEMGRMEFLKAAGLAVVSVFGVGALLRMLEGKVSAETAGAATAPVAANTSVPDISVVGLAGGPYRQHAPRRCSLASARGASHRRAPRSV